MNEMKNGFYAKFELENSVLEGDLLFSLQIDQNIQTNFWLNSNFIQNFHIAKYNKEIMITPEEYNSKYLNFSHLNLFKENSFGNINKNERKNDLMYFTQELFDLHPEIIKYLTKKVEIDKNFNIQNKNLSLKYGLEYLSLNDLDNKKKLLKSKITGANFGVFLIFLNHEKF